MTLMQTHHMMIIPRYLKRSIDRLLPLVLTLGLLLIASLFSAAAQALANTKIVLQDGSVIVADIIDYRDGEITLSTSFSRDLKIDSKLIKDIQASAEDQEISTLLLKDGRQVVTAPMMVTSGLVALSDGEIVKLGDVSKLNPEPWELGKGYAWEGLASAALAVARGNTDADQLDLALNSQFDSVRDRITLRANVEQDTAIVSFQSETADGESRVIRSSEPSADNWQVVSKYDYYLEDWTNHYLGVNASVEADAFADIRLRSYLGPYYGRKLLDGAAGKLDGELGFVWIATDFLDAEDTEYLGANWNITGESAVLGGDSRVYLTHVGILNMSDDNSVILDTTIGFGFPFFFGLEAAAEFTVDYDGAAAEGKKAIDQSYNLRVGYSW